MRDRVAWVGDVDALSTKLCLVYHAEFRQKTIRVLDALFVGLLKAIAMTVVRISDVFAVTIFAKQLDCQT